MTTVIIENEAWTALEEVYDPCSIATRSPLNIVAMGLVREVEVDADHNVEVSICPTSPSCMLMASITQGAERELAKVDGIGRVKVRIDAEFFWTPEEMTAQGKAELAQHRADRSGEAPIPLGRAKQRA